MVIALATKPGINGANTLSIPKDWDATWFRKFIANSLKGADVRNAVGSNGISVTGSIASPYATISFGTGPITITGLLTIVAPNNVQDFVYSSNSQLFKIGVFGTTTLLSASGPLELSGGGNASIIFGTPAGSITGLGANSGTQVDMAPDSGSFTGTLTGFAAGPTGTLTWVKIGNLVTITCVNISGTSNATSMTMTGLPAVIQPARRQLIAVSLEDNGLNVAGLADTAVTGTVTFYRGVVNGTALQWNAAGFTASGTKGLNLTTWTYSLT